MGWTNGARMGKLGCLAWLRRRLLAKSGCLGTVQIGGFALQSD